MAKARAPLDMGANKITALANGSASADAAAFGQIPVISTAAPQADGTAAAGSAGTVSDAGHVHPATGAWLGKAYAASLHALGT